MTTLCESVSQSRLASNALGGPEPSEQSTRQPGVLIALVDPAKRADLAEYLTGQGMNVWTSGCGVEAIATYLEQAGLVDLLLLDAELPDLPGPAFLRRFKRHFPGVPCLFRAGSSEIVTERLRNAGATIVSPALDRVALADQIWEVLAFEFLIEA